VRVPKNRPTRFSVLSKKIKVKVICRLKKIEYGKIWSLTFATADVSTLERLCLELGSVVRMAAIYFVSN